jgi:dihydroorotate dehydrogenase (fumarate)
MSATSGTAGGGANEGGLATRYLGLRLPHPFMPGASPLAQDLDMVLRLEDAGAAAITMHSLFEEDVRLHGVGPDRYLEQLRGIKRRVGIPVIASLNGTTADGWLQYAALLERAGADALELNVYEVPTRLDESSAAVERRVLDIVAVLKESIAIPLAVKLSPFYSSLPHLAAQLDRLGADGLVLFNRFYQPDIDPLALAATLPVTLSDSSELPLRLRAIAILFGRIDASLAVTGGVHTGADALKAVLAGADAVQLVSALLRHGPDRLRQIRVEFEECAARLGVQSLQELRGLVSLNRLRQSHALERASYVRALQQFQYGGV